jgi:hypothetical protein
MKKKTLAGLIGIGLVAIVSVTVIVTKKVINKGRFNGMIEDLESNETDVDFIQEPSEHICTCCCGTDTQ